MNLSFVYKNSFIYSIIIKILYGKNYKSRFLEVAKEIDEDSSVLDVCSGDCALYDIGLKPFKNVKYKGLEINQTFINNAAKRGLEVTYSNILVDKIPEADFVVLQGSLYQFHPDCELVLKTLMNSARKKLIVSEPVQNLSSSSVGFISKLSKKSANPGDGHKTFRFNERTLIELVKKTFPSNQISYRLIPGKRDLIITIKNDSKMEPHEN